MKQTASLWALVATLTLVGCQHNPFAAQPGSTDPTGLIGYAGQLVAQDPDARSRTLAQAHKAYQAQASPRAGARLGLALGQPGYDGYDPGAARKRLDAARSDKAADWSERERAFLALRRSQIQRHATGRRERRRLASENRQLTQKLEEAKRKLRAISEIEQDIGPRGSNR